LQNQQAGTTGYHTYPFGLFEFKKRGKHHISVHLVEGDRKTSSLKSIRLSPAR
jgi:alpha-L-fucosidase